MPLVVVHREDKFNEVLRRLRNNGGTDSIAYRKIGEIRQSLDLGVRNVCQTTDHGEGRITNCVKYDLGNGYRLVTVDFGEVVMLCHAGKHDDVDHWLDANRGRKFTYDKASKKIEVVIEREVATTAALPAATNPPEDERPYLEQIDRLDWVQLIPIIGARRRLLRLSIRSSEDEINETLADLEADVGKGVADLALNVIIALRDGQRDVAARHRDLFLGLRERATPETPITPATVMAGANSDTLVVLNDLSEAEFDALWDPARFQDWMVYLHPGQRRVVDEDFDRPVVFTGVSGSGKTCVLVHRALRLSKMYPGEPILLVTLNRSLASLIERLLDRLSGGTKHSIKVMAFYDYLESVLRFSGLDDFLTSISAALGAADELRDFVRATHLTELTHLFAAREEYELEKLWRQFVEDDESGSKNAQSRLTVYLFSQDQGIDANRYIRDELTLVRSAFRLVQEYSGYEKYDRGGRCIQFQDKRRDDVLKVLRTWELYQLRHGKFDSMGLTQAALMAIDDRGGTLADPLRFRAVLVDEFQDFSTLDLEILSKIPTHAENGLFLTGDTAQKIYTKDFDLPRAGLGPASRVNRSILKNYRNSRQILQAAQLLIETYANESTAKHEGVTLLNPEFAQRDGAKPFACSTNDALQAAWTLAGEWLASGYAAFSVCIATANPDVISVREIRDAAPSSVTTSRLTGDYLLKPDVVVVSDIYNIKGFEFSLIVVVGLGEGEFPPKGVPAGEAWREALRLYVAMTRGRDEVCLVYEGTASPFIMAMEAGVTPRPIWFEKPRVPTAPLPATEEVVVDPEAAAAVDAPATTAAVVPDVPEPIAEILPQAVALPLTVPENQGEERDHYHIVERSKSVPEPEPEITVLNGISLIPIRGEATVRSVSRALGKSIVQVHNDFMRLGVFGAPDAPIVRPYVYRVFEKYDCSPIFRR